MTKQHGTETLWLHAVTSIDKTEPPPTMSGHTRTNAMQKSSELHSPQSLRESSARIRTFLSHVEGVIEDMEAKKIDSMRVDFQAALTRAMKDLNRWAGALDNALTDALEAKGAFRASEVEGAGKRDKGKKPKHPPAG